LDTGLPWLHSWSTMGSNSRISFLPTTPEQGKAKVSIRRDDLYDKKVETARFMMTKFY